jgi:hypothetical protein
VERRSATARTRAELLAQRGAAEVAPVEGVVDEVLEHAAGALEQAIEALRAVLADEVVGVDAGGQGRDLGAEAALAARGARGAGGLAPGAVAVEEHGDGGREALEQLGLRGGEGGAEGRDDVGDAAGVQGDDVEVALDEDALAGLADRLPRLVQAEEVLALGVDGRLGAVDVLGGRVVGLRRGGR